MRRLSAVVLVLGLLLLTACAGFPSRSPVNPGNDRGDIQEDPGVAFVPDGPQPGASPEQIVQGFLSAGSGSQDAWATARQFLTADFAELWQPLQSVTIDRLGDRSSVETGSADDAASVLVGLTPTGVLDAAGAYLPQTSTHADLPFTLRRQADGQWRIAQAPNGIVLHEELFRNVFQSASLAYFDPTWQYLVPDVRWFPRANIASRVARALIHEPPAPFLDGAVVSAFPPALAVAGAVPLDGGVAQVELGESALALGAEVLGRMQAQLDASMRSVDIPSVRMTVDGSALAATAVQTGSTRVDPRALGQTADGAFGFLGDGAVESLGALSGAIQALGDPVAVEVGRSDDTATALTAGRVVRSDVTGTAVLDTRASLIAPALDPFGTIWSVPADAPGAVLAFPRTGESIAVAQAWPQASSILALRVSRDGARVAAIVSVRGRVEVWVSGIRRTSDPARIELDEPLPVAAPAGEGLDLAWLDDTTLGVLERVGGEVRLREQTVGGPGTDLTVPAGTVRVVGGNSQPRLLTDAGVVYARQSTTWQQLFTGVRMLASQESTL